jgi:hypothetical protein
MPTGDNPHAALELRSRACDWIVTCPLPGK